MQRLVGGDLFETARASQYFRRVLATGAKMQLVCMSLAKGERLAVEVHDGDQLFVVMSGRIEVTDERVARTAVATEGKYALIVEGTPHSVVATEPTKLFTVYAPAQHAHNTIQITNPEAQPSSSSV